MLYALGQVKASVCDRAKYRRKALQIRSRIRLLDNVVQYVELKWIQGCHYY